MFRISNTDLDGTPSSYINVSVTFEAFIESIQYNVALGIIGAIRGTCRKIHFEEAGPWVSATEAGTWNYVAFTKLLKKQYSKYGIIPKIDRPYSKTNVNSILHFKV